MKYKPETRLYTDQDSGFRLNPNIQAAMGSGFKACLERPFQLSEPQPEFALTEPGALEDLLPGITWFNSRK